MSELKTLKDFKDCQYGYVGEYTFCFYEYSNEIEQWCDACQLRYKLKREAIKCVKNPDEISKFFDDTTEVISCIEWIKHFFNISEVDLSGKL